MVHHAEEGTTGVWDTWWHRTCCQEAKSRYEMEPASSGWLPPVRVLLLKVRPKQLGTKGSNTWAYGGHFTSKPHSKQGWACGCIFKARDEFEGSRWKVGVLKTRDAVCAQQLMDGRIMAVKGSVLWGYPLGCSYRGDEGWKRPWSPF